MTRAMACCICPVNWNPFIIFHIPHCFFETNNAKKNNVFTAVLKLCNLAANRRTGVRNLTVHLFWEHILYSLQRFTQCADNQDRKWVNMTKLQVQLMLDLHLVSTYKPHIWMLKCRRFVYCDTPVLWICQFQQRYHHYNKPCLNVSLNTIEQSMNKI